MKIDYRETKIIKDFPQAEICNLPIGDIEENGYCIERKAAEDFLLSILNNHMFNQAISMYATYPGKCVIIVEGDLKSLQQTAFFGNYKITIEAIRGAIASLYTKYHVPVLFVSTRNGFVEMTNKLLEKYKESLDGNIDLTFIDPPMCKAHANPKLQILMQVPKIGRGKAKKILDHYSNFENLKIMERPKGISQNDIDTILEILK